MQILITKGVARFVRRERVTQASLVEAIERATRGIIDADLGGGLIKQRVARPGQGRSGGFRMIVAYQEAGRAVFLYGFAKSDLDNIDAEALRALRIIGANWLAAGAGIVAQAIAEKDLKEIDNDDHDARPPP